VALFGATALGKSAVADVLAERLGAEIVVADSMQVYQGLAIVTNQPAAGEGARRHLVGIVPPQDAFTAAEYARRAHEVIDELRARGRAVVVEGGSGLYLRAALGISHSRRPGPGPAARARAALGGRPGEVRDQLRRLDPDTFTRVDTANPRRVTRALEAVLLRGGPCRPRQPPSCGGDRSATRTYSPRSSRR